MLGRHVLVISVLCVLAMAVASSPVFAQWIDGGTPVCTAPKDQKYPSIAPGPMGSSYIIWTDYRNNLDWNIYIQKMARSGHPMWDADGVGVCTAAGGQNLPKAVADGHGGVIVVWRDARPGTDGTDLYAQRIDQDGNHLWGINGTLVTGAPGDQTRFFVVADGTGGAIVFYNDIDYSNTQMQRLRSTGDPAWGPSGLPAWTGASMGQAIPDCCGGAFFTADTESTVNAQRVDTMGTLLWGEGGVSVASGLGQIPYQQGWIPILVPDGDDGIILFWTDLREPPGYTEIFAQRIDGAGNILWVENGISICSRGDYLVWPFAVEDGDGGAIITFEYWPGGQDMDLMDTYAQRIDSLGTRLWGDGGVAVCTVAGCVLQRSMVTDGEGGAIISWTDCRYPSNIDPRIQRLSHDGTPLWTINGIRLCSALGTQEAGLCISDGEGGAILPWSDQRDGHLDIYAQRVNGNGGIVATMLAHMVLDVDPGGVRLEWMLSEEAPDAAFAISRKDGPDAEWKYIEDTDVSVIYGSYVFEDKSVEPGGAYRYRIDIDDKDGYRLLFETEELVVPAAEMMLHQNHPNPFNPSTTISFYLPERCRVRLEVFDVSGRRTACLVDDTIDKGPYSTVWNGNDRNGNTAASGVYFYRLTAGKKTISKKMILLR